MRAGRHSRHMKVVEPAQEKMEASREATARVPQNGDGSPAELKPRAFVRVPTHVIGVADERRVYPRAALNLPLRLKRVGGQREPVPISLVTRNISSSGVYFLCPRSIEPGTPIELEVGLVERPLGRGSVRMSTAAHVVRIEPTPTPGWHGLAVAFDDITFYRDELIPSRFRES